MSEAIWNDIDDALVTFFTTQLGLGSANTTLKVRYVAALIGMDVSDWDGWSTDGLLPAIIVQGQNTRPQPGEHGTAFSSPRSIGKEYPYLVCVVAEGERRNAERNAKILVRRVERAMLVAKTLTTAGNQPLLDAGGEQVQSMRLENVTGVRTFRKPDTQGEWYGVGAVALTVRTQT